MFLSLSLPDDYQMNVVALREYVQTIIQPKLSIATAKITTEVTSPDDTNSSLRVRRWMTGNELATLVERLVPKLNDMAGAAM